MEDSAIKEGFAKLKAGKDFDALFESAQARAIADWLPYSYEKAIHLKAKKKVKKR